MTAGAVWGVSSHCLTGLVEGGGGSRLVGPARTTQGPQPSEDRSEAWPAEREAFLPAEYGLDMVNE